MKTENSSVLSIEERLSSSDWDVMIAKRVISRRRKKFAVITGLAGFAAAASLAIVLTFTLSQNNQDTSSISFITAQLEGSVSDASLTTAIDMDFFAFEE
jgi:hypothetical protein